MASWFDSGIAPAREALRILKTEGLVSSPSHRGARVADINPERVRSLSVIRRLTESYAVARATGRISRRELRQIGAVRDDLNTLNPADNIDQHNALTCDCHMFFYERAGMSARAKDIALLRRAFPWDHALVRPGRQTKSSDEHRKLVAAVGDGDDQRATELVGGPIEDPFQLNVD